MEFDWQDIALAGALAEEMTEEERERMRQLKQEEIQEDPLDEIENMPDDTDIDDLIP